MEIHTYCDKYCTRYFPAALIRSLSTLMVPERTGLGPELFVLYSYYSKIFTDD